MSDKMTCNRYKTDDGRRAEKRLIERVDDKGNKELVVETYVEQVPFVISERVIEKVAPVVTERRKETYSNGQLIDTFIEQVPDSGLHLTTPVVHPDVVTKSDVEEIIKKALAELLSKQQIEPMVYKKIESKSLSLDPEPQPAPVKKSWWSGWLDLGLYVILSAQLAFIVYQGFLKGLIER